MKKTVFYGILMGVFCLLTATSVGLVILHLTDLLYRADMFLLKIPQMSGLSEEVVLRNYKAMLSFLSPFSTAPFSLPDLVFSDSGAIHFEECRNVFRGVYLAGIISAFGAMLLRRSAKNNRVERDYLKVATMTLMGLPLVLFVAIAINANAVFVLFHRIFFRNNYWIFSSITDPVITILPMDFFIHAAAFIMLWWILAGAMLLRMYKKERKHRPIYAYLSSSSQTF